MLYKSKILTEPEIGGKNFEGDVFNSCKLININFRFTNFINCEFKFCDFSGSIFDIVGFTKCSFQETKLSNLDFSGAKITKSDFSGAIMVNCIFQQLKTGDKNRRKKFSLKESRFGGADLKNAVFVLCNLSKVNFRNADLKNSVFEKCDLTQADFTRADINGVSFEGSKIDKTKLNFDGFIKFGNSKGFVLKE